MKRFSFIKYIITIAATALLFNACNTTSGSETETHATPGDSLSENEVQLSEAQYKMAAISLTSLSNDTVSKTLKTNGIIDVPPQNLVSISCPLGGYLKSTEMLPGSHVVKGQVIARIEDQQFIQLQQDYLLNKSKLQLAELEYNRQKELNASKATSDKAFQQAEAELRNYKILLASQAEKLKLIHIDPQQLSDQSITKSISITSPIDGFVSKVNANIGKYLSPTDVLFELVNPTDIHLNLTVFEKDIASLRIGQKVMAYTNMNPENKYQCEIILISKEVSPEGTTQVHCHFDSYDPLLLPGIYMNADIECQAAQANTVPAECLLYYEGKNFVFTQRDRLRYEMVEVSVKGDPTERAEIQNPGLLSGKKIVQKGAYTLLMALKNKAE